MFKGGGSTFCPRLCGLSLCKADCVHFHTQAVHINAYICREETEFDGESWMSENLLRALLETLESSLLAATEMSNVYPTVCWRQLATNQYFKPYGPFYLHLDLSLWGTSDVVQQHKMSCCYGLNILLHRSQPDIFAFFFLSAVDLPFATSFVCLLLAKQ